ncbi:DUF5677 domain-containing protein [Xanthobacter versatilis]|uniref:DUF5677 domain-containing protein n=1 Tax=Xanthobacter autotrophicus (strain ATCC BAA-1158 / Py2) TaxID=78245 RepID=UPI00372A9075
MTHKPENYNQLIINYVDSYKILRKTTDFGKIVSENCSNNEWQDRYSMSASLLFAACMASESMLQFLPKTPVGRVDHYSAANLSRMVIEHCMMLHYLTEDNLSDDEISLRILLLHLHDASARYRLFKGFNASDEDLDAAINLALIKGSIDDVKKIIRDNKLFKSFDQDKKSKMLGGQVLYINGLRKAAKLIGYKDGEFDSLYSYLSAYSHGAPMSFYRAALWGVNAIDPAAGQIGVAATALKVAEWPLAKSIIRMAKVLDINPITID